MNSKDKNELAMEKWFRFEVNYILMNAYAHFWQAPPQSSPLPVATMAPASSAPSIPRKRLVIEEIDDEDEETIVIPSKDAQKSKIAHLAQELPVAAPIINETSPQIAKVVEPVPNPVLSAASTITDTAVLTPPKTIYEFQRDWKMYKTRGDAALYAYMKVGLNFMVTWFVVSGANNKNAIFLMRMPLIQLYVASIDCYNSAFRRLSIQLSFDPLSRQSMSRKCCQS